MTSSVAYEAAKALQKLLPQKLPPSLSTRPGNLYEVISRYPNDGVGRIVHQTRWGRKGIEDSYWRITRSRTKLQGTHGKAWGLLYWKGAFRHVGNPFSLRSFASHYDLVDHFDSRNCSGKQVSLREEQIPGGLKYQWSEGSSKANSTSMPSQAAGTSP
jgi:small subunit ribosomal protein S34